MFFCFCWLSNFNVSFTNWAYFRRSNVQAGKAQISLWEWRTIRIWWIGFVSIKRERRLACGCSVILAICASAGLPFDQQRALERDRRIALQIGAIGVAALAEDIEDQARDCIEYRQTPDNIIEAVVKLRDAFERTVALIDGETNPLMARHPILQTKSAAFASR